MKVIIDPSEQLKFKPIKPEIKNELENREGNKDFVYNLTPFVRVSCLQEVAYTDEELDGKSNNLKDTKDSVLVDSSRFNGFQFVFESDFEESYGEVQKIGKTLDNKDVRIKNPRRVPPPSLDSFNASVGQDSDYFTTAQLSFTCNSLEQLQFLVPFLFNPGNTIFVEFGHNTEKLKNQISLFDADDADALVRSSVVEVDCNQTRTNNQGFIARMNQRIFDSGGAYDFFYGIVNDFDFNINDSLGYDCTVDLIAASKMKLKAPNTHNYNDISSDKEIEKVRSRTLNSELKTFEDKLYELNKSKRKDRIFSFNDTDSTTYVRLDDVFGFLNGEYFSDENQLGVDENEFEGKVVQGINGSDKTFDNIIGSRKYISVKKADYENGEPPIVSYSSDVLMFRKEMWNPSISYDKDKAEYVLDKENIQEDFVNGSVFLKESVFDVKNIPKDIAEGTANRLNDALLSNARDASLNQRIEERLQRFNATQRVLTKFRYIKPYLMDEHSNEELENLFHCYINFYKFKSIYISSHGKVLDVLKKLADLINEATDGLWDIQLADGVTPEKQNEDTDDVECEQPISTYVSVGSATIDNGDTYTFKAESKGSVFTNMGYSLGLDGLLGDQIYMNSLNSTDGSADSQKLNLLLFSNHENNLKITDKRNERISSIRKKLDRENNGSTIDTTNTDSELNKKEIPIDVKRDFFGRFVVGRNNSVGQIPQSNEEVDSTLVENMVNSIQQFINEEGFGQNPTEVKMEDLEQFYIPYVNDEIPRFDRSDIIEYTLSLYETERIPLVYSPLRSAINNLRAQTNNNYQPKGEKNSTSQQNQQRRDRSFKKGGINPLLESTMDITLVGIGGINPLEYVKVSGIPDVYAERGEFCIMNVSHTVTPSNWQTEITTRFRPTYEDE